MRELELLVNMNLPFAIVLIAICAGIVATAITIRLQRYDKVHEANEFELSKLRINTGHEEAMAQKALDVTVNREEPPRLTVDHDIRSAAPTSVPSNRRRKAKP